MTGAEDLSAVTGVELSAPAVLTGEGPNSVDPVVFLRGELDLTNVEELRHVLDTAASQFDRLIVDVKDTTFIDCAVLGVLANAEARLGGHLRIRGADGFIAEIFDLLEMRNLLIDSASTDEGEPS